MKQICSNAFAALLISLFFIAASHAERTYGPVQPRDYLGKIAAANYPDSSLNIQQIMVAILRANPEAFKGGNIHFLRQKTILKLPDEQVIAGISRKEASALIAEHLAFFNRGQTGSFTHKPLPVTAPQPASADTTATTQKEAQKTDAGELKNDVQKIINEAEQATAHTRDANDRIKQLENLNSDRNKVLETLDDQIRELEEKLKKELEKKQGKTLTAKDKKEKEDTVVEQNTEQAAIETSELADKTISALENRLITSTNNHIKTADATAEDTAKVAEEINKTNLPERSPEKEAAPFTPKELEFETAEDQVTEAKIEKISKSAPADKNQPASTETFPPPIVVAQNTTPTSSSSANSNASQREKSSTDKAIPILIAFALGLVGLGYLLLRDRDDNLQTSAASNLSTSGVANTAEKIADRGSLSNEQLLSPVLKKDAPLAIVEAEPDAFEAEMKINMARAYVEIGYLDTAKEVLEEVLEEGVQEQQETVKQMLDML